MLLFKTKAESCRKAFNDQLSGKSGTEFQVFISDFQVLWDLSNKEKKAWNITNMCAYPKQEQADMMISFQMISLRVKRGNKLKN